VEFDAGHEGFYGPPPTESEPLAWHPRRPPPAQCREAEPVRWALEAPHPGPQPQCCHVFAAADACGARTREYLLSPHGGCAASGVRARLNRGLVIDCFAGGGGASTGIEQAIGRAVDVAINHSPAAVAMHKANHPTTKHWCQDIRTVTPRQVCGDSKVWIVWLSPDCFPAGTMVLTRAGYRPIEQIAVGDEVLTHAGRWRPVTRLWHSQKQLTEIRGHGHPGLVVSPGHPILTRRRDDQWNNAERRTEWHLGPASWQPASVLGKGNYWSTPTDFPASEAPPLPAVDGRRAAVSVELMWLAGRYIADGWTRLDEKHAELVLSCGKHKVDVMRERLAALSGRLAADGDDDIRWSEREQRTARQFTACHRPLVEWLREHFGHLAPFKHIPGWALGLPADLRQSFLDGYLSGDGHRSKPGALVGNPLVSAETVSRALAFGLKALASSLGKTVNVYLRKHNSTVIEGRQVNARPIWKVTWRDGEDMGHKQTWREGGFEWAPIREQTPADPNGPLSDVYTLSVAEDESYVAEGVVVKNCTHHSRAKGGKPRDQKIRSLARVAIDWANDVTPDVLFLENVIEFKQWGPLDAHGKPIKARAGEDFELFVRDLAAAGPGYDIEFRTLVAADFGTPTSRTRLFMVARRKGSAPIAWPDPTHGKGKASPWKTAAEIIDFTFPTRSIFGRKKPLRPATLRRIATGLRKYVIESQNPFIIPVTHQGAARTLDIGKPLTTVVADGQKHNLVAALLTTNFTGAVGRKLTDPAPTVTGRDHTSLTQAHLASSHLLKLYGTSHSADVRGPLPTVTGGGQHLAEVRALMELVADPGTLGPDDDCVTVRINGHWYVIVDIHMRMLQPKELFGAQGFPSDYAIHFYYQHKGKRKKATKTDQIKLAGNSVCPQVAKRLILANAFN
jgi:site-specific DNA-cytosine methylase